VELRRECRQVATVCQRKLAADRPGPTKADRSSERQSLLAAQAPVICRHQMQNILYICYICAEFSHPYDGSSHTCAKTSVTMPSRRVSACKRISPWRKEVHHGDR
jgi:hypothetical protein